MLEAPIQFVPTRTGKRSCEVAWFDDLCGGDTAFLGILNPERRRNYPHCADVKKTADHGRFRHILLSPSYITGREVIPFAPAMGPR